MNSLTHFTVKGHLVMSFKEVNRLPIVKRLVRGAITEYQAAGDMGISIRQTRRLKKRYLREGVVGLRHKSRGRPGSRRISPKRLEGILNLVKEHYHDFGPTLAVEKLREYHGVAISRETLRKAMIVAGLWQPKKRKKPRLHQTRVRRGREGELVQLDGSPHAWFEDRGDACDLLVFIDDATGKLKHLEFVESESTNTYFQTTRSYLERYGKPIAFYVDKHSTFRISTTKGGSSNTQDSQGLTQFGRAMKQLGIELIFAHSPQAKGRVERVNSTLQDRLVKELRLRRIGTIDDSNHYLPKFMEDFNRRFAVRPRYPEDAHRSLLPEEDLGKILVEQHTRVITRNLEFQYQNVLYQIVTKRPTYTMRHAAVLVTQDNGDNVRVYYKGKELKYQVVAKQPKAEIIDTKRLNRRVDAVKRKQKNWRPTLDHPWRRGPRVRRNRTLSFGTV